MKPTIKLIVNDASYAAGLTLEGYADVASVLIELGTISCRGSASLFLEDVAAASLRSGRPFRCSNPMLESWSACTDIVEVEIDARIPCTPFVQLHRIGASGAVSRTHTGHSVELPQRWGRCNPAEHVSRAEWPDLYPMHTLRNCS
jgi:hypothetical protein